MFQYFQEVCKKKKLVYNAIKVVFLSEQNISELFPKSLWNKRSHLKIYFIHSQTKEKQKNKKMFLNKSGKYF